MRTVGSAISIVDAAEIELRGYTSMADLLRTQPGIGVSNYGGQGKLTTVRIRGEEHYRTLVLVDGVEVSDPTGPQVSPNFSHLLATSDIGRIEILRGPQGFMYGADAGGVVNVLSRSGQGPLASQIGLELGQFSTSRLDANLSGGNGAGDFFISATDLTSSGFNSRSDDSTTPDDDGYDNTTFHTKLGWNLSDNMRVQLVARDIDSRTEYDLCGFPTTHDCVSSSDQTTYRLSADYTQGSFTHAFAYASSDIARDELANGLSAFATNGSTQKIEYTGSYRPSTLAGFVYGVEIEDENLTAGTDNPLSRRQNALYFEIQGHVGDRISVTLGGRRDDNEDFGAHDSIRATTAYVVDLPDGASLKYRIGYGTGFRAPSLSEIAYNAGPFALPPAAGLRLKEESSKGYDLGMTYTRDDDLLLEVSYFDQSIEDEIYFDLSGFSGYLQSLGTSNSRGVELAAQLPIGQRWQFLGNFTWNETRDNNGLERIRRPERIANFALSLSAIEDRLRLLANLRISSDAVDEIFGVGRVSLDAYEVLDLSGIYQWNSAVELYGRIENLTDENYTEVAGFLVGGRAASLGLRYHF